MIPYEELEKHFKAPKHLCKKNFFYDVKRLPRKFKKKWKHILQAERYNHLNLGQKLWYIQHISNNYYNRFLIKQIVKHEQR